jgi:hypothetical protein
MEVLSVPMRKKHISYIYKSTPCFHQIYQTGMMRKPVKLPQKVFASQLFMCIVVYVYCINSQCFHPLATATRINNYKAEQEQMNIQSDKLNYNLMENINCVNKPELGVSEVEEFRENSKMKKCVGRESNPGQLLGRQLCSPLYHRRLLLSEVTFKHIWLHLSFASLPQQHMFSSKYGFTAFMRKMIYTFCK